MQEYHSRQLNVIPVQEYHFKGISVSWPRRAGSANEEEKLGPVGTSGRPPGRSAVFSRGAIDDHWKLHRGRSKPPVPELMSILLWRSMSASSWREEKPQSQKAKGAATKSPGVTRCRDHVKSKTFPLDRSAARHRKADPSPPSAKNAAGFGMTAAGGASLDDYPPACLPGRTARNRKKQILRLSRGQGSRKTLLLDRAAERLRDDSFVRLSYRAFF